MPNNIVVLGCLLLVVSLTGCERSTVAPTAASSTTIAPPAPASAPIAAVTPVITATGTATPPASPTPTAPASDTATPPVGPTPPAGYAESCAAGYQWARQVTTAFVCISEPASGMRVLPGAPLTVNGYAGGSFENNVVIEVHRVLASGGAAPESLVLTPLTYIAADIGTPGFWRTALTLPTGLAPGPLRVIARFNSPRDGALVAQATVDITLQ